MKQTLPTTTPPKKETAEDKQWRRLKEEGLKELIPFDHSDMGQFSVARTFPALISDTAFRSITAKISEIAKWAGATRRNNKIPVFIATFEDHFRRLEQDNKITQLDYLIELSRRTQKAVWVRKSWLQRWAKDIMPKYQTPS